MISHPVPKVWTSAFISALSKLLVDLGKISKPSNYSFVDFLNIQMENQPLMDLILYILKLGNITPSHQTILTLRDLEGKINQSSAQQE